MPKCDAFVGRFPLSLDEGGAVGQGAAMGFQEDASIVEEIVRTSDPAFAAVHGETLEDAIQRMHVAACGSDAEDFLLAAMRLVALAGNGHSRVIPNLAISVVPYRIVLRDGRASMVVDGAAEPIVSVNGVETEHLFVKWQALLAGTRTRQRMLSGLMMAWPAALRAAGVEGNTLSYELQSGRQIVSAADDHVGASTLYPVSDNGFIDPDVDEYAVAAGAMAAWQDGFWHLRIAELKDVRAAEFSTLVKRVQTRPDAGMVIDLRGNTGGDYTKALPLIDWLATQWRGARCAVLVNGYTFSAAIVVAVLLVHHLGARVRLFGSDVGDALAFHAEGDTAQLPQSGGLFRYSSAWHDWENGIVDVTTPEIIAQDMVGIGALEIVPVSEVLQMETATMFAQGG